MTFDCVTQSTEYPRPVIFNRDTVSWDRRPETVTYDAQENPVAGHATGFPADVECRFQVGRFRAGRTAAGADVYHDARAYSETFLSGRVGDLVTFRGIGYRVVGASPRSRPLESAVSFVRYDLVVATQGDEQE